MVPHRDLFQQPLLFIVYLNGIYEARLTKAYDVTIQGYRNSHAKNEDSKMHTLRCMGSKICVKFQRYPLKFHTKLLNAYTAKYAFCEVLKI